jgi:hypothetical protein
MAFLLLSHSLRAERVAVPPTCVIFSIIGASS